MKNITKKLRSIKAAALVEYGILVGLIAVLAIVAVLNLGSTVRDTFDQVSDALSTSLASAQAGDTGSGSSDTTTPSTPIALAEHSFTAAPNPTNTNVIGRGISSGTTQYGSTSSTTGTPAIVYITTHVTNNILFVNMDGDTTTSLASNSLSCDNGLNVNFSDADITNFNNPTTYYQFDSFTSPHFVNGQAYTCTVN
jgi:Flp pilus assembly pilin Flp